MHSNQNTRKKPGSFLNFLSVKEPSSQALVEYQQSLKKQQSNRALRPSAVGLSMVSSAKMPPEVPKVNSKWTGVPSAIAGKEKTKKTGTPSTIFMKKDRGHDESQGPLYGRRRASSADSRHRLSFFEPESLGLSLGSSRSPRTNGHDDLSPPFATSTPSSTTSPSFSSLSLTSVLRTPYSDASSSFTKHKEVPLIPLGDSSSKSPMSCNESKITCVSARNVPEALRSDATPIPLLQDSSKAPLNACSRSCSSIQALSPGSIKSRGTVLSLPPSPKPQVHASGRGVLGPPSPAYHQKSRPLQVAIEASSASCNAEGQQLTSILKRPEASPTSMKLPMSCTSPVTESRPSDSPTTQDVQSKTIRPLNIDSQDNAQSLTTQVPLDKTKKATRHRLSLFRAKSVADKL